MFRITLCYSRFNRFSRLFCQILETTTLVSLVMKWCFTSKTFSQYKNILNSIYIWNAKQRGSCISFLTLANKKRAFYHYGIATSAYAFACYIIIKCKDLKTCSIKLNLFCWVFAVMLLWYWWIYNEVTQCESVTILFLL